MKFKTSSAILIVLALFAGSAWAQNDIFLTLDPGTNQPTMVAEPNPNSPMHFKSINYLDPANPEPFILRFGTDFIGKYQDQGGVTTIPTVTSWGVIFSSNLNANCPVRNGTENCQEIVIKLDNSAGVNHPDDGYKYDVVMGTAVLDPRVRGR